MRVMHRFAAFIGMGVALSLGQRVHAQDAPGSFPPAPLNPPTSYSGSLTGPEYAPYPSVIPPTPPPIGPNGVDGSTINPYPAISPFDFSFSNFFDFGGLWRHREETSNRKYYFNADFLFMQTSHSGGTFGNPTSQNYTRQERDFINGSSSTGGSGSGSGTGSGTTTTSSAGEQLLINQGYVVDTPAQIQSYFNNYNAVNLSDLSDIQSDGLRLTFGFWNPDKSGLALNFWYGGNGSYNYNAADYNTQSQYDLADTKAIIRFLQAGAPGLVGPLVDDIGVAMGRFKNTDETASQILEQNLLNLRGLPVADGTARGQTIPYDLYFGIRLTSQQIGTGLDYYLTPLVDWKWFTLSPSVGFKYLNVRQGMSFLGIDSGLLYGSTGSSTSATSPDRDYKAQSLNNGIDDNVDGIIDNAGAIEAPPTSTTGGSGSSGSTTTSGFLLGVPTTFNANGTPIIDPFGLVPATIDVTTNSNIFGPTAGLRYLIGSEQFHIIGETKFGVMANLETITLSGNNIGSTTRVNGNPVTFQTEVLQSTQPAVNPENQQDLIIPTPENPNPNAFSSTQSHSHVSPFIEQSLILESQLFKDVPVLNKCWPLSEATFRGGYTLMWVGSMISTNQSVFYQGDPMAGLFPQIQVHHESWYTGMWNVGVSWDF